MIKDMRKKALIVFVLIIAMIPIHSFLPKSIGASQSDVQEQTVNILFIGNSHTYYNDMTEMVKGLALAEGIHCNISSITASGYKLYQFADENNEYGVKVKEALSGSKWDYVVLQENREKIVQKFSSTQKAVESLYEKIEKTGAKLVMYATQSDKIGNNFAINRKSMYLTNFQIGEIITRNNFAISNEYQGLTAASGVNFMRIMTDYPDICLYKSDNLHPSVAGSYLAACTIYATIFQKSPVGNKFLPGSEYDTTKLLKDLDENQAVLLQQIADAHLSIDKFYATINKGETDKLSANVIVNEENHTLDSYSNKVYWSSVDQNGISINKITGEYTALSTGKHLVMAQTDSGLISYATIDVKQPSTTFSIMENKILKVTKGYCAKYTPVMAPADTTDTIQWASNEPKIVSVDSEGKITARKVGIAKITAVTTSGLKINRYVRVKLKAPSKVTVKKLSTKAKGKKYANIKVQWKKNKNAVAYYVYRKRAGDKTYKKVAVTTKNSFVDKNKKKKYTYYYKIKAVYSNSKCNSNNSTAVKIKI